MGRAGPRRSGRSGAAAWDPGALPSGRGGALRGVRLRGRIDQEPRSVLSQQCGRHRRAARGDARRRRPPSCSPAPARSMAFHEPCRSPRTTRWSGQSVRRDQDAVRANAARLRRRLGADLLALRYFNAAGADPEGEIGECHVPETHVIPLLLDAAAGDPPASPSSATTIRPPDGTCIRDYIHVTDLADAHVRALRDLLAAATARPSTSAPAAAGRCVSWSRSPARSPSAMFRSASGHAGRAIRRRSSAIQRGTAAARMVAALRRCAEQIAHAWPGARAAAGRSSGRGPQPSGDSPTSLARPGSARCVAKV